MRSSKASGMEGKDKDIDVKGTGGKGTTSSRAVKMRDGSGLQPLRGSSGGGPSLRPAQGTIFARFVKRGDSASEGALLA